MRALPGVKEGITSLLLIITFTTLFTHSAESAPRQRLHRAYEPAAIQLDINLQQETLSLFLSMNPEAARAITQQSIDSFISHLNQFAPLITVPEDAQCQQTQKQFLIENSVGNSGENSGHPQITAGNSGHPQITGGENPGQNPGQNPEGNSGHPQITGNPGHPENPAENPGHPENPAKNSGHPQITGGENPGQNPEGNSGHPQITGNSGHLENSGHPENPAENPGHPHITGGQNPTENPGHPQIGKNPGHPQIIGGKNPGHPQIKGQNPGHPQITGYLEYQCQNPESLTWLQFHGFKAMPGLKHASVWLISDHWQSKQQLSNNQERIQLQKKRGLTHFLMNLFN
ncbi:DUF2796 domain-containing protein [Endozoicomonas sp.]|uniref:ZrgA family zinc uptake protein n=1 Tax=Endozoicomonas sp. TaxID=1892382 RepID=UPI00383B5260